MTGAERAAVAELLVEVEVLCRLERPEARVAARFDLEQAVGSVAVPVEARPADGSQLTVGGTSDPLIRQLRPLFLQAMDIHIVAAFVQASGLHRLRELVERARVRVLTGDDLHITQAAALERLLDWTLCSPEDEDGPARGPFEGRSSRSRSSPTRSPAFTRRPGASRGRGSVRCSSAAAISLGARWRPGSSETSASMR